MNRYKLLFFGLLLFCLNTAWSQPLNRSTEKTNLNLAKERFDSMDYYNSREYYEKYREQNKKELEAKFNSAELNFLLRDYTKANNIYNSLINSDRKKEYADVKFNYGKSLMMTERYDDALLQFSEYVANAQDPVKKKLAETYIKGCQMAPKMKANTRLKIENAGKDINCATADAAPFITLDGQEMYYSSMASDSAITLDGKQKEDYFLKIFKSKKGEKGWEKGEKLNDMINREGYYCGNASISRDGKRMYFTQALLQGNVLKESKIYVATMSTEGWGAVKEVAGVNGEYINRHPMAGELFGREVLFFSSNMPGGQGGYDIYYANIKADDAVADPVNLGEVVNTVGDEFTPFYQEGKLYFSTDGMPGLGGLDIFYTTWNGTNWITPSNMGRDLNSFVDDWYFTIDKAGYDGLLVSNRPGGGGKSLERPTCCDDIYTFNIEKFKASVSTLVTDASSGKVVHGFDAQLIEMTGGKMGITDKKNADKTNQVDFPLTLEKTYNIIITKEGYYPDTIVGVNTVALMKDEVFNKKVTLRPKEPEFEIYSTEEPIRLDNIYYDYDDDKILPSAEGDLNLVLDLMKQYPDLVIEFSSHTDSRGDDDYNMKLSQRRANSARDWLVKKNVSASRIQAVGYGETKILNKCTNGVECTDEEHRFNRRTEFRIISGPTAIKIEKKRLKGSKEEGVIINKIPAGKVDNSKEKNSPNDASKSDKKKKEPLLKFTPTSHFFGVFTYGDKRSFTFNFVNTSNENVEIELASGCECMSIDWTHGIIKPGDKGFVSSMFDSKKRDNYGPGKSDDVDDNINVILTNKNPDTGGPMYIQLGYTAKIKGTPKTK